VPRERQVKQEGGGWGSKWRARWCTAGGRVGENDALVSCRAKQLTELHGKLQFVRENGKVTKLTVHLRYYWLFTESFGMK